ncbi:hypothetical protein JCM6882_002917 [Rhodosporidiobolus microsporus]
MTVQPLSTTHEPADPAVLARYLLDKAEGLKESANGGTKRYVVALAGIPGSGKSTFSNLLLQHLTASNPSLPPAIIVPQDGFHRTQAALRADPDPAFSFKRRGSPFTFDPDSLLALVKRLRTEPSLAAPAFSHAEKDPVEDAIHVEPHHRIVLLEGSFLLLDQEPWRSIAREADERWLYDVSEEIALLRVIRRHVAAGLAKDETAAEAKALGNDVLNGRLILECLVEPDKRLQEMELTAGKVEGQ